MDTDYHYKYLKYYTKYNKISNIAYQEKNIYGGSNEKDISKILQIAKKVQIIGMAEATHGQQEITKFRMKVFKNLVKKSNYRVFILEDQYSCCELINDYIQTGNGKPKKLLSQLSWYWWSNDMLKIIMWMRKYNQQTNNKIEFHGIDIQAICDDYPNKSIAKYVKKLHNKNQKVDQDDWTEADGFRDESMFNVFMKIYDPTKKYFIYAHNYHIAKQDLIGSGNVRNKTKLEGRIIKKNDTVEWFGCLLKKEFGTHYFSIGNIFTNGGYLETFDIIEQRRESGFDTHYKFIRANNAFIIVYEPPGVGNIDPSNLPNGLTIFKDQNKPFDAIMIIDPEMPLKLINY